MNILGTKFLVLISHVGQFFLSINQADSGVR